MGARTGGRAVALQVLYGLDAAGMLEGERRRTIDVDQAIATYFRSFEDPDAQAEELDPEARAFAESLLRDLAPRFDEVDEAIRKASTNWRLERMPRVDRNVLRVATLELVARRDVPRPVAIDEAVELAKRYGGDDSAKFVNGILERVADDAGRGREDRPSRRPPRRR
ncbi:MAG: transcription antitermination factor NusB [Deltaproteobacteria bacterium]|nr:transcription antitermination factor NusB [Deltaproteobacteria bacterium]